MKTKVVVIESKALKKKFRVVVTGSEKRFSDRLLSFINGEIKYLTYRNYDITNFVKSLDLNVKRVYDYDEFKERKSLIWSVYSSISLSIDTCFQYSVSFTLF